MGCTQLAQGKRYGSARVQSWSYRPVECEFRPVETEFDQLNLKFDGRDIVMFVPLSSIFFSFVVIFRQFLEGISYSIIKV